MFRRYWYRLVRFFWWAVGRRDAYLSVFGIAMGHTILSARYVMMMSHRRFWVWQRWLKPLVWDVEHHVMQAMLLERIEVREVRYVTTVACGRYSSNGLMYDLLTLPVAADMLRDARMNHLAQPGTVIRVECVL